MKRLLLSLGMSLLFAGGTFLGRQLLAPSLSEEPTATAATAYLETSPCADCPVSLESAEAQAREGSTLFVFGGNWPTAATELPSDVRLNANDLAVTLHPTNRGFEVTEANGVEPADVAIGLQEGSLLLNIAQKALSAPVRFVFGLWDGTEYTTSIPRSGRLAWSGAGVPRPVGGGSQQEPTEEPAEPATPPVVEEETPEAFLESFAAAYQSSDDAFLFDRLDPIVLVTYGARQCRRYLEPLEDLQRAYEVVNVSEPAPWDYAPDGVVITVDGVHTVNVRATIEGATEEQELHLGSATGQITWFTDCDDPTLPG